MNLSAWILLVWTVAMLAVHLRSRQLIERMWRPGQRRLAWLTLNSLVRFEGLYYIAAVIYAVIERRAALFVPIAVLAVIHFVVWAAVERRADFPAAASERKQLLDRIQIFDWGESVALVYIAWWLAAALYAGA